MIKNIKKWLWGGVRVAALVYVLAAPMVFAGPQILPTPFTIPQGAYSATFVENRNNISIIQFSGSYDRELATGDPNFAARAVVAKEFYEHHNDDYDFLVVFSSFEFETGDALAFYSPIANDVQGIGRAPFSLSHLYGSNGKLQGYIDMAAMSRYNMNPYASEGLSRVLKVMAHENLHRWAVHTDIPALQGRDDAHWNFFLNTGGSVEYGHDWHDNGDNTFTAEQGFSKYGPLDLYLMGINGATQVPPTFYITPDSDEYSKTDLPKKGVTVSGTRNEFTIQEFIDVHGERIPSAEDSQKTFRYAFIYLTAQGEVVSDADIAKLNFVREAYAEHFSVLTDGKAIAHVYPETKLEGDVGSYTVIEDQGEDAGSGPPAEQNVQLALQWLREQQLPEGSWQDKEATIIRDTTIAFNVLRALDDQFSSQQVVVSWLDEQQPDNTDSLARLVQTIPGKNELVEQLIEQQNSDGGWGLTADLNSTALDTALAVYSLSNNNADQAIIDKGVDYLYSQQNSDGGWGFVDVANSSVNVTAEVLQAIKKAGKDNANTETALDWLVAQKDADNGFGTGSSSVHETALTILTLLDYEAIDKIESGLSIQYITQLQNPSGSWEGSVYTTALAVQAMQSVILPNLKIASIVPEKETVSDGERLKFTVRISNDSGDVVATNVVRFYQGDPEQGGTALSELAVPQLAPFSSIELMTYWDSFDQLGQQSIYAVVDVNKSIVESSETDNTLSFDVLVTEAPDGVELEANSEQFLVEPSNPTSLPSGLNFTATVRNLGKADASSVSVQLWQGDQDSGRLVDTQTVSISNRSSLDVNFADTLTRAGKTVYTLVVDSAQNYSEENENNNTATTEVNTINAIDLEVLATDIITPANILLNQNAEFKVTLRNKGTITTPNTQVDFTIANANGAQLLQSINVILAPGEEKEFTIEWLANFQGVSNFLVELDAANMVAETSETNNNVSVQVSADLAQGTNLSLNYQDLSFNPNPANEGFGVTLSSVVYNTGTEDISNSEIAFYEGNPQSGGVLIGTSNIINLASGSSQNVDVVWPQIPDDKTRFIYVVADPANQLSEISELDNSVFAKLEVQSLPDFAVSSESIQVNPNFPKIDEQVQFTIKVTNTGKQSALNVPVDVYLGQPSAGGSLLQSSVLNLSGGSDEVVQFDYTFTNQGTNEIVVVVDAENNILESSTSNNTASRIFNIQDGDFYVSERFISPDGNGIKDFVEYVFNLQAEEIVSVVLLDQYEREVIEFNVSDSPVLTGSVTWDGKNQQGAIVSDGEYRFTVKDEAGNYQGFSSVIVDTNRSAMSEALGTEFELTRNLTCRIGKTYGQFGEDKSDFNSGEYPSIIYGPNDQFIYFVTYLNPYTDSEGRLITTDEYTLYPSGVYRANSDGSGVVQLLSHDDLPVTDLQEIAISKDGERVLLVTEGFVGGKNNTFWSIDRDGENLQQIAEIPLEYYEEISNVQYVNNNEIIYWLTNDSYFIAPEKAELWRLTDNEGVVPELINALDLVADDINRGAELGEAELVLNKSGSHALIAVRFNQIILSTERLFPRPHNYFLYLVDINTRQSQLIDNKASSHSWSPNGSVFAMGDVLDGNIKLYDLSGSVVQTINFPQSQFDQYTAEEKDILINYINSFGSFSEDSPFGLMGRITEMTWNADASEFAFVFEDYIAAFINSKGCDRGGNFGFTDPEQNTSILARLVDLIIPVANAVVVGGDGSCVNVPENVLTLLERYKTLDGVYVAKLIDSSIEKVAVTNTLDFSMILFDEEFPEDAGSSMEGQPLFELTENSLGFPLAEQIYPYIIWSGNGWGFYDRGGRPYREMHWLTGGRQLLISNGETGVNSQNVLLDLDNPEQATQYVFTNRDFFYRDIKSFRSLSIYPSEGGKFLRFSSNDEFDGCISNGQNMGERQFQSLLNLTADLRVRRAPELGGVLLEGSAVDKYFANYQLDYADVNTPDSWQSVAPASNIMVISNRFTTWVPPYIGNFYVRLTVTDLAGNSRQEIQLVNNSERSSISGVYLTPQYFSPNADEINDQAIIHFRVLENVNLEVVVYNESNAIVRNISESFDLIGSEQQIRWDGRDNSGFVQPDGLYRVVIQNYEFFVRIDNTRPEITDITNPLFTPPNTRDPQCRWEAGEQIPGDGLSALPLCSAQTDLDIAASVNDNLLLNEIILESKTLEQTEWNTVGIWSENLSQSYDADVVQSLNSLAQNQYRFRAIDAAGNESILQVDESLKQSQAHVVTTTDSIVEPYNRIYDGRYNVFQGFAYRDKRGFGVADNYLFTLKQPKAGNIGFLYFLVYETVREPIRSLEILHRPEGSSDPFQSSVPIETAIRSEQGNIIFPWRYGDLGLIAGNYEVVIRLTAEDNEVVLSDTFRLSLPDIRLKINPFEFKPYPDDGINGFAITSSINVSWQDVERMSYSIQSLPDMRQAPADRVIDPFFVSEQTVIEVIPDSSFGENRTTFAYANEAISLRNECGYIYRVKVTAKVEGIDEPFKDTRTVSGNCDVLNVSPKPVVSESCNAIPTGLVDITMSYENVRKESDDNNDLVPIILQMGVPVADQASQDIQNILFNINLPEKDKNYQYRLDTTALPAGDYKLRTALVYEDGSREIRDFVVPIVRTAPQINITYPENNATICATQYVNSEDEANPLKGIEVQGEIISAEPAVHYALEVDSETSGAIDPSTRYGDKSAGGKYIDLIPGNVDNFVLSTPRVRLADGTGVIPEGIVGSPNNGEIAAKGVLGIPLFLNSSNSKLIWQAYNWSGARQCKEVNVEVDAEIDSLSIATTNSRLVEHVPYNSRPYDFFSPNGDGKYDDINFRYIVGETVIVDMVVFSTAFDAANLTVSDVEQVAMPYSSVDFLEGVHILNWDGFQANGQPASDGIYRVYITSTDGCGNVVTENKLIGIDNTAPIIELIYPGADDDVALQIRITGKVEDEHPETYQVLVSEDGVDYSAIGSGADNQNGVLADWNTFGLTGLWNIRLQAEDKLGNEAQIDNEFELPERQNLISSHSTTEYYVSPNADGRLDTLVIRSSFETDVEATFTIIEADSKQVVRILEQDKSYGAGYTTVTWDGKNDADEIVADGLYIVELTAQGAGNSQTEEAEFELDNTAPEINFNNLTDGYVELNGGSIITGSVADKNFSDYELRLVSPANAEGDNLILEPIVLANSNQQPEQLLAELSESLLEYEGEYEVTLIARDKAGNYPASTALMIVDLFAPTVVISSPDNLAAFNAEKNSILISGEVTDTYLKEYEVSVAPKGDQENTTVIFQSTASTTDNIAEWSISDVSDGVYIINILAVDRGGLQTEKELELVIDNQIPEVSIGQPLSNGYITEVLPVIGVANDDYFEQYTLALASGHVTEGGDYEDLLISASPVNNNILFNWNELPEDGDYTFKLSARDTAGNSSVIYHPFIVDTTPPATPELESAEFDKDSGDVVIVWTENSEADLAGYDLFRNGSKINNELLTEIQYTDSGLPEGEYQYTVRALDQAGLRSELSNSITVKIDITPPTVSIITPQENSKVNLLFDVTGTAFSEDDFKEYRVYAGQTAETLELFKTSSLPVSAGELAQWNTIELNDNTQYLLRLEAEDTSGNIASDEITVTVDNTAPGAPDNLAAVLQNGNDVALSWQHATADADLLGFLLYRNNQLVNADGPVIGDLRPYAVTGLSYDDLQVNDGDYDYIVYAIDDAGNISLPSNVANVVIDVRAPIAVISNVENGQAFENSLYMLAESEDNDIANVVFEYRLLGDILWTELSVDESLPFEYQWDTSSLADASYEIRAVATDNFANVDNLPEVKSVVRKDLQPPAPVQNMQVSVNADIGSLSWDENEEADLLGYYVYRRCGGCSDFERLTPLPINQASYQDNINYSDNFYYAVTAVDQAENESARNDEIEAFYFDVTASFDDYFVSNAQADLQVGFSINIDVESIQLSVTSPDGSTAIQETTLTSSTQPVTVPVILNQFGSYQIVATATAGEGRFISGSSETVSITRVSTPSQPTGLTAEYNDVDDNISLQWNANPVEENVAGYKVYRNGQSIEVVEVIEDAVAAANSSTATINNILPTSTYGAYWRSTNSNAEFSQTWPAERLVSRIELDWQSYTYKALGLTFFARIDGQYIEIAKIESDDPSRFQPQQIVELGLPIVTDQILVRVDQWRSRFSGGRLLQMRVLAEDIYNTSAYYQDQPEQGFHTYQVSAVSQYGVEGALSEVTPPVAYGDVEPPAPVTLQVDVYDSDVELSWNTIIDAAYYRVYRDNQMIGETPGSTFDDYELANGTYSYYVTAFDIAGNESDPSNIEQAIVNIPLLAAPVNLLANADEVEKSVTLNWEIVTDPDAGCLPEGGEGGEPEPIPVGGPESFPPAGGTDPVPVDEPCDLPLAPESYNIYRSLQSGTDFELLASSNTTDYVDQDIELNVTYYYHVVSVDYLGNESASSNEVTAQLVDSTAPDAPVIFSPTDASQVYQTKQPLVDIAGIAEPDSLVYLLQQGSFVGEPVRASSGQEQTQFEYTDFGYFNSIKVSPEGKVIGLWEDVDSGSKTLLMLDGTSWEVINIPEEISNQLMYNFMWDGGDQLLFEGGDGQYYLVNITNGEAAVQNYNGLIPQIERVNAFSGNNNFIIVEGRASLEILAAQTYKIDLLTGQVTLLPESYDSTISRNGKYWAYTQSSEGTDDATVHVIDLLTGNEVSKVIEDADYEDVLYFYSWSQDSSKLLLLTYKEDGTENLVIYDHQQDQVTNVNSEGYAIDSYYEAVFMGNNSVVYYAVNQSTGNNEILRYNIASNTTEVMFSWDNSIYFEPIIYAASGNNVYVFDEADELAFVLRAPGSFQFEDVELTEGENQFSALAVDQADNIGLASDTVTIILQEADLPDLTVDIAVNPEIPLVNNNSSITLNVSNIGELNAPSAHLTLLLIGPDSEETELLNEIVNPLNANSFTTFNAAFNPELVGEYNLVALIDDYAEVEESSESNNNTIVGVNVVSEALPVIDITLNASQAGDNHFSNNEALSGQLSLINAGESFSGTIEIQIVDQNAVLVESLETINLIDVAYGDELSFPYTWNTASNFVGSYQVQAILRDTALVDVASVSSSFVIDDVLSLVLGLTTNAYSYDTNESVIFRALTVNNANSLIFEGGDLTLEIFSPDNVLVFSENKSIAELLPTERSATQFAWNVQQAVPGNYSALLTLRDASGELAQSVANFEIRVDYKSLSGNFNIEDPDISEGESLSLSYDLNNKGNIQLENVDIVFAVFGSSGLVSETIESIDLISINQLVQQEQQVDTTQLTEGEYQLRMLSRVVDGNSQTIEQLLHEQSFIVIESTPPAVSIQSPLADSIVNGQQEVASITATDESGVRLVEVSIDNGDWISVEASVFESNEYVVRLNDLIDGVHTISARAIDNKENNSPEISRQFIIDNTEPLISFDNIQQDAVFNNAVSPFISVADTNLQTTSITLNGQDFASGSEITADGNYTISVFAEDQAGNVARSEINFTIDTTPPVISITGIENNAVYGQLVEPVVSIEDVSETDVEILLNGVVYDNSGIDQQGEYEFVVNAIDAAGNSATETIVFALDLTAPLISIDNIIQGNFYNSCVTPQISVTDDNLDTNSIELILDTEPYVEGTEICTEGNHVLSVSAEDVVGNNAQVVVDFNIDTSVAVINISGVENGGLYNTPVTPVIEVVEANPGTTTIQINGQAFSSGDTFGDEGQHILTVEAIDLAGNSTSVAVGFEIDLTPPAVPAITSHSQGQEVNTETVNLAGTTEANAVVTIEYNGISLSEIANTDGDFVFADLLLTEGLNQLNLTAADAAGNQSQSLLFELNYVQQQDLNIELAPSKPRVLIWRPKVRFCRDKHYGYYGYSWHKYKKYNWNKSYKYGYGRHYRRNHHHHHGYYYCKDREYDELLNLLESTYQQADIEYYIATSKHEFVSALRSQYYNTMLLSTSGAWGRYRYYPFVDYISEIKAAVASGVGLILMNDETGQQQYWSDLIGARHIGSIDKITELETSESQVSEAKVHPLERDKSLKLYLTSGMSLGEVRGYCYRKHPRRYHWRYYYGYKVPCSSPGLVLNKYGLGSVIYMPFNPVAFENEQDINQLLGNITSYVKNKVTLNDPLAPIDISWLISELDMSNDLKVKQTIAPEATNIFAIDGEIVSETEIEWLRASPESSELFSSVILSPENTGEYHIGIEVFEKRDDDYILVANKDDTITVDQDIDQLAAVVIQAVESINARGRKDEIALYYIRRALRANINSKRGVQYAINNLSLAIHYLTKINAQSEIAEVARLLKLYQLKWYLYVHKM